MGPPSQSLSPLPPSCPSADADRRDPYRSIRDEVAGRIKTLQSQYPRFKPQLAIIQAGARPDSSVYVRMKAKAAEEVGIQFKHVQVPEDAEVSDIVDLVQKLNDDETVSGILVQLPLGPHVGADGERTVTEAVSPEKDVDGYAYNRFSLAFCVAPSARARRITPRDLVCADSELACEPAYLLLFGFNHLEAPAPTLR